MSGLNEMTSGGLRRDKVSLSPRFILGASECVQVVAACCVSVRALCYDLLLYLVILA